MGTRPTEEAAELVALAGDIARDAGQLIGQHVDLLKAEVTREVRRAAGAGVNLAAGGGLAAAGGVMAGVAAVHLVQRATGLPLWACYAGVGGALGATGLYLARSGQEQLSRVQLFPPPETAAAVREDVAWLAEQVTPAART